MRTALEFLRDLQKEPQDHLGLAYDMFAPVELTGAQAGKVSTTDNNIREEWFDRLEKITIPDDYQHAYKRWLESFEDDDNTLLLVFEATSRLLLGHGNPSPSEVGLTVHHTWGTPILPGPSIKGLTSHYLQIVYGPSRTDISPFDPDHPEPNRAVLQGVHWEGSRIKHSPGAFYRELFGAPAAETDTQFPIDAQPEEKLKAAKGKVIFHDAWMVPSEVSNVAESKKPFAKDILTVHQGEYYKNQGETPPNDWEEPTPVSFLTVRPKSRFLVALTAPTEHHDVLRELICEAMTEWGLGGKTAAGYGQFSLDISGTSAIEKAKEEKKLAIEQAREDERLKTAAPIERERILVAREVRKGATGEQNLLDRLREEVEGGDRESDDVKALMKALRECTFYAKWKKGVTAYPDENTISKNKLKDRAKFLASQEGEEKEEDQADAVDLSTLDPLSRLQHDTKPEKKDIKDLGEQFMQGKHTWSKEQCESFLEIVKSNIKIKRKKGKPDRKSQSDHDWIERLKKYIDDNS